MVEEFIFDIIELFQNYLNKKKMCAIKLLKS